MEKRVWLQKFINIRNNFGILGILGFRRKKQKQ